MGTKKNKRISSYFKKKIIGGFGVGTGIVFTFGIYMLVQAVTPGVVTNPFFGPHEDDVEFTRNIQNCQWMPNVNAGRPNFARSDCPAGTTVLGYRVRASNNDQEDWELYVLPDHVRARRISDGSSMWAQAYCCEIR